jgi:hypothetical protein
MAFRINRPALLGALFAVTAATAIAGATVRSESRDTPLEAVCAAASWPMLPAGCIEGGSSDVVRVIEANRIHTISAASAAQDEFRLRFEAAFSG